MAMVKTAGFDVRFGGIAVAARDTLSRERRHALTFVRSAAELLGPLFGGVAWN